MMKNPWWRVEHFANTMTCELRRNRVVFVPDEILYGLCDILEWSSWLADRYGLLQSHIRYLNELPTRLILMPDLIRMIKRSHTAHIPHFQQEMFGRYRRENRQNTPLHQC